jgi:hypothetical protein
MIKNVGSIDRIIRFIIGGVILLAGIIFGSLWGLIGLIPIATAFIRFCPAYTFCGMNSCNTKE